MRLAYGIDVERGKSQRCRNEDMYSGMIKLNSRHGTVHGLSLCLLSWLCTIIYQTSHIWMDILYINKLPAHNFLRSSVR